MRTEPATGAGWWIFRRGSAEAIGHPYGGCLSQQTLSPVSAALQIPPPILGSTPVVGRGGWWAHVFGGVDVALVSLRDIHKHYGSGSSRATALRGVSLEIEEGAYVSIVGSSGSGKSTLMNILGLLDRPSAGAYRLRGREMTRLGGIALATERNFGIGFVFQGFHLLAHLRLIQNVALPLCYRGLPARERHRRALAALEAVGIVELAARRPTQVSGGQQQRAAIARALVTEPDVILADEPTGALDTRTGEVIMHIFQRLNRQGLTIIQVTHEPDVARHARRIVTLRDGLIVAEQAVPQPLDAAALLREMPELPTGGVKRDGVD